MGSITITRGRSLSPETCSSNPALLAAARPLRFMGCSSLVRAALPRPVLRSIWCLGPPVLASPISVVSVQARVYSAFLYPYHTR